MVACVSWTSIMYLVGERPTLVLFASNTAGRPTFNISVQVRGELMYPLDQAVSFDYAFEILPDCLLAPQPQCRQPACFVIGW